ncbi:MAG TPA: SRPBCC family protein [Candidatus Angelobacter sp.]|nr:SRPBCC family protein [Candidatus Angelobacter sp.]
MITELLLQTVIDAPIERCFDLARSIDLHVHSASLSREQAVGGITRGLIGAGQEVEWRAGHFGLWLKMRVRITAFNRPAYFQDAMVSGPFRHFKHDHNFQEQEQSTLMVDKLEFESPMPPVGSIVDAVVLRSYLRNFLEVRNRTLQAIAESDEWRLYLK